MALEPIELTLGPICGRTMPPVADMSMDERCDPWGSPRYVLQLGMLRVEVGKLHPQVRANDSEWNWSLWGGDEEAFGAGGIVGAGGAATAELAMKRGVRAAARLMRVAAGRVRAEANLWSRVATDERWRTWLLEPAE